MPQQPEGFTSTSGEPIFTPGGKRKRCFGDDAENSEELASASKQSRTRSPPPAPLNFTSSYYNNLGQPQSGFSSPLSSSHAGSHSNGQADVFGNGGFITNPYTQDYFNNRNIEPLHSQAVRRLSNLSPNEIEGSCYVPAISMPPTPGYQTDGPPNAFSAQPFSMDLQPPKATIGLMQPSFSNRGTPMDGCVTMGDSSNLDVAEDVAKARNVHGPHCQTIPKLVLSDYPDPTTGQRSMWTMCSSCGSVEMCP